MRMFMSLLGFLGALWASTTAAQAEITSKSEIGFVVSANAEVSDKTPDEVWKALLEPQKWWDSKHTWSREAANLYLDAQAGGCLCELIPLAKDAAEGSRRGSVEHARVIAVFPSKMLRLSGAFGPLQSEALIGTVTIRLKKTEHGTSITWSYIVGGFMRMKADDIAPLVDTVVAVLTKNLAEYAQNMPKDAFAKSTEDNDAPKPHQ